MSNTATDCPVWKRYLEVVASSGGQANYLPAKSALYKRLLEGKQPLVLPPPLSCSYPWYAAVESDKVMAPLDGPFALEARMGGSKMDAVLIEQTPWCVVERVSALELIVSQPGWHELGFRWRYWHHPMRADESQACLIAHYAPGAGRITTSAQLDLECRHHAEHWRSFIEISISALSDEVKLTAIDPGIEDQSDPLRFRMRRSAAHIRLAEAKKEAQTRKSQGLPAVPTSAEVDSYAVRYRDSLLAGAFEERDGWLFVDGWALQRIAPSAIGPEHYLPGAPVPATAVREA